MLFANWLQGLQFPSLLIILKFFSLIHYNKIIIKFERMYNNGHNKIQFKSLNQVTYLIIFQYKLGVKAGTQC